jgi:hypothetical protein
MEPGKSAPWGVEDGDSMIGEGGTRRDEPGRGAERWPAAWLRAAIILVLAVAGFMIVPDRLLVYLSTRVTPHARDALVTLWTVAFFIALSWIFVALQRRRTG